MRGAGVRGAAGGAAKRRRWRRAEGGGVVAVVGCRWRGVGGELGGEAGCVGAW